MSAQRTDRNGRLWTMCLLLRICEPKQVRARRRPGRGVGEGKAVIRGYVRLSLSCNMPSRKLASDDLLTNPIAVAVQHLRFFYPVNGTVILVEGVLGRQSRATRTPD
jgi:hypothetical protein